jgi:hypothetical protein
VHIGGMSATSKTLWLLTVAITAFLVGGYVTKGLLGRYEGDLPVLFPILVNGALLASALFSLIREFWKPNA